MLQIHERIKNERIKAGLTEDELADRLHIGRSTYQYWEKKTPAVEKVKKVAIALGLPDDYFFGENDEKNVSRSTFSDPSKKPAEPQPLPVGIAEALAIIKQQNEFLQRMMESNLIGLSKDLRELYNEQVKTRAELRGYEQRHIYKEVNWDKNQFLHAMAEVGKLIESNLITEQQLGNQQDRS